MTLFKYDNTFEKGKKLICDKDGVVDIVICKTHNYSDLPMKGLGKDFSGVGFYEPVIITLLDRMDSESWGCSNDEITQREHELSGKLIATNMPMNNPNDFPNLVIWFSNK